MKKKIFAGLLAALMVIMTLSVAAFAQTTVDLDQQQEGKLMITEAGSYVLQGKLTGCVYVDPGEGEVELILDGVDIDGSVGAGIIAVSGDSLKITLPEGSVNRVIDGGADDEYTAAIYSEVETSFEGEGSLYVTGNNRNAVFVKNKDLTLENGNYAVKAENYGFSADRIVINNGHYSMQAAWSFDPAAELIVNGGIIEEEETGTASSVYTAAESTSEGTVYTAADYQAEDTGLSDTVSGSETGSSTASSDLPEMPEGGFDGQQMPEMPEGGFDGQQMPEMPEGGMQQNNGLTGTVDSASEVVEGTMTNSAASLEADYENATYITVTDDENQVTITSSGTYVVTGTCSDGNITVAKGTTGVVLVLEDLDLTSTTGATVSINKAAEVKIIISGEVVLTDNENPDDENSEDEEVADAFDGAALKAKADSQVYVTGDGTLVINGNAKNGIKAGDDSSLIFDGVTVDITAVNDGINGNYDVTLLSGTFTISAGDDAIHADHILTIGDTDGTGPVINVTESTEGLEGTVVNIYGGDISIVSSDDAVNAANGDGLYEGVLDYSFNMMGGRLVINSQGDGIDSNGNVNLIGGSAKISSSAEGGEAGIDYDGDLYVSDDFSLNNQTGTAGPDGMMGGMPGQGQSFSGQAPFMQGGFGGAGFGGQMP